MVVRTTLGNRVCREPVTGNPGRMIIQEPAYRLYATVVDQDHQTHSEGPYEFATAGDALDWIKHQDSVTIVEVKLLLGDEVVAEVR